MNGMSHAILLQIPGDTSRMLWQEVTVPPPEKGEALIRQTAIGVNYIDIYHRTGLYPLPAYPAGLGVEAAGVVERTGPDTEDFREGDRVAYALGPVGAYAERRVIKASQLVKIPDGISDTQAAMLMVKGLTAHYLLRQTFPVKKGDTVLVHAAAGGVGLLLCQWANHLGATVIGTVSTEEKAALARQNGCHHPILYTTEKVSARVRELTGGRGADVVYDSVGAPTFQDSLSCLRPLGMMVSFGQSGGKVAPFDIGALSAHGSLFLTRPTLGHYISETRTYRESAAEMFDLVKKGVLTLHLDRTLPLKDAASAHRLLESRATKGAVVLEV